MLTTCGPEQLVPRGSTCNLDHLFADGVTTLLAACRGRSNQALEGHLEIEVILALHDTLTHAAGVANFLGCDDHSAGAIVGDGKNAVPCEVNGAAAAVATIEVNR